MVVERVGPGIEVHTRQGSTYNLHSQVLESLRIQGRDAASIAAIRPSPRALGRPEVDAWL